MVTITTGAAAETELVETGEKRDALGRRRTPAERRTELLAAYRRSGLTQRAFAQREGVNYTTFCTWAQAERRRGRLPAAPAGCRPRGRSRATQNVRVPFVEVQLPPAVPDLASGEAGLEVRLPDGTSVRGGSAAALAKLVRALRA
jgi:transposase-like protein